MLIITNPGPGWELPEKSQNVRLVAEEQLSLPPAETLNDT